jgi:hypothetical protein
MKLFVYLVACCALITTFGCGGATSPTQPSFTSGKVYVTNGSSTSILRFNASMSGNVVPQNNIPAPGVGPIFLTIDVQHDRLAGGELQNSAFAIIDNASTSLGPIRTISGPSTTLGMQNAIAINGTTDLIYVLDTNEITGTRSVKVFGPASTINGDVAPLRVIDVSLAANGNPGMLLDSANDRLFISDCLGNAINVFDHVSTLNGTVAPSRVISGPATQLHFPDPMALDRSGNLIVASNTAPATVLVFANAATASGNLAPMNAAGIDVNGAIEIAVSPADELFVVDGGATLNIYKNISASSGNLLPARTIGGPQTGLDTNPQSGLISPFVYGLALDSTRP